MSTAFRNSTEDSSSLPRRIAVLLLVNLAFVAAPSSGKADDWQMSLHSFEAVGMNIFIPVTVTGSNGRSKTVDFILDSGTTRTTIDPSVAVDLNLLPYQTSQNTTPSGKSLRYTTKIAQLCSFAQCSKDLEVLVDDLSLYTAGYNRPVAGLLGMDFQEKYILLIDFQNSRIGFLPGDTPRDQFKGARSVDLIFVKGLALIPAVLPNGQTVKLILDTGYDSLVDALLYEAAVGKLDFTETRASVLKDVNGSFPTPIGTIDSLDLGWIRFAPALVQLSPQNSAGMSEWGHAGLVGMYALGKNVIAVDYPKLKLLVLD
jgi:predicted aspartyl protease